MYLATFRINRKQKKILKAFGENRIFDLKQNVKLNCKKNKKKN